MLASMLTQVSRLRAMMVVSVQVTSGRGEASLLTAKTGSELWRLVRKGVAPAFNPQNIRWAPEWSSRVVFQPGLPAAGQVLTPKPLCAPQQAGLRARGGRSRPAQREAPGARAGKGG